MAELPGGTYTLLPWVRQGLTASPLPADTLDSSPRARVLLPVQLNVNADPVKVNALLYGPGDVIGIDPAQIVRTDPRPRASNVEAKYLAGIEFARPDFPWLFTPASANAQNLLRPWLCLVVVRRQDGVRVFADQHRPLPTLEIAPPARIKDELPDLDDSWAWAHAQALGTSGLEATLKSGSSLSRLLCPRQLDPNTAYIACLVPAFDIGCKAGLGKQITNDDESKLLPAWRLHDPELITLQLPVYHTWEFSTGSSEDFESLVKKLVVRDLPATIGIRPMGVTNADPDLPRIPPDSPDAVLGLEGALMSRHAQPKSFTTGVGPLFRDALRRRLAPPADGATDPLVAPPIYGARHANQSLVPSESAPPHWLRDLNLDPRYRAVAALGTAVVQAQQEELMAAAWDQVGEIERANQVLRQAQLVRAANQAVHRNQLERLPEGVLLQITRAVHSRVLATNTATLQVSMAAKAASGAVAPSFRRIARPRGPLVRRALPPTLRTIRPVVQNLATGQIMAFVAPPVGGMATVDSVEARYRAAGGSPALGNRLPSVVVGAAQLATTAADPAGIQPGFYINPAELPGTPPRFPIFYIWYPGIPDSGPAAAFRRALPAHQPLIQPPPVLQFFSYQFEVDPLRSILMAKLDPTTTVAERARALISFPGPRDTRDELEPIMAAPEFPTPMYEGLRDLAPELLLPGLKDVEDNTVAMLKPNPRFIEAYMVGLNHEFARELLWRDYPTDQRGSYFRQFWDTQGRIPAATTPDLPPLHAWAPARGLGQNMLEGNADQLVLLIRGELLRRYPNPIVYAVRALGQSRDPQLGTQELYPMFRGAFDADIAFFGFSLTEAQAKGGGRIGDPGWFFVIQQHPTEPRFGLDVRLPPPDDYLRPQGTSATTAQALLQRPVRVAIHATALLP